MTVESQHDIDGVMNAGRVVACVRDAMLSTVEPGMTTAELDKPGDELLDRFGAKSAPRVIYNFPGATCTSINGEAAHGIPGHRIIQAGDVVKFFLRRLPEPLSRSVGLKRGARVLNGCCAMRNMLLSFGMIKSFRHKGLRCFYESGSLAGIQPQHAKRLQMQLAALDTAASGDDMDIPGFRLHPLKGSESDRWSIWVTGNWRLTFEFRDGNAYVLDYEDYH